MRCLAGNKNVYRWYFSIAFPGRPADDSLSDNTVDSVRAAQNSVVSTKDALEAKARQALATALNSARAAAASMGRTAQCGL